MYWVDDVCVVFWCICVDCNFFVFVVLIVGFGIGVSIVVFSVFSLLFL